MQLLKNDWPLNNRHDYKLHVQPVRSFKRKRGGGGQWIPSPLSLEGGGGTMDSLPCIPWRRGGTTGFPPLYPLKEGGGVHWIPSPLSLVMRKSNPTSFLILEKGKTLKFLRQSVLYCFFLYYIADLLQVLSIWAILSLHKSISDK